MTLPTDAVRVFAAAKINLFLHVGEKRADGYHELESLVAFADAGDTLDLARADRFSLHVEGPFAAGLTGENLVTKAAEVFAAKTGQSVNARITLTKNLPVASGIGGGSADAAATLHGLAEFYPDAQSNLGELAAEIGSDVPACVVSKPLMMRGRGERIEPLSSFPTVNVLLVNPGVEVSTAEVFRRLKTPSGTGGAAPKNLAGVPALVRYLLATKNDLQAPAREIAPVIGTVLDELSRMPGILLTRMSGSGATCFGIFESGFEAEIAATALKHSNPGWWIQPATLR